MARHKVRGERWVVGLYFCQARCVNRGGELVGKVPWDWPGRGQTSLPSLLFAGEGGLQGHCVDSDLSTPLPLSRSL